MTVNELRMALALMPSDAIMDIRYPDTLNGGGDTHTGRLVLVEYLDAGKNGHWVTLVAKGDS